MDNGTWFDHQVALENVSSAPFTYKLEVINSTADFHHPQGVDARTLTKIRRYKHFYVLWFVILETRSYCSPG